MPESWTISVDGRVYGPYNAEQMRAFHGEGRLARHSLVARGGEEQFHPAGEDPLLASLFSPLPAQDGSPVSVEPHAGAPQISEAAELSSPTPNVSAVKFGHREGVTGERNRYVIIADMKSGSISVLEEEIFNLGPACRFMPQAWILTSGVSLSAIRGSLIRKLGKLDSLIIVDARNDKAAWFNFGPELDTKVRRMWSRPDQPKTA
jgi:hypothetical protein